MAIKPIGILGGGQLARMMALEAHRLGIDVVVLCTSAGEPAAQVARYELGHPDQKRDLEHFLKMTRAVTFESEFYDAELIAAISEKLKTPVLPSPIAMATIQDRLRQKQLLERWDIPTAAWRAVDSADDAETVFSAFRGRVVYKKRRFGYDGNGTFVVRSVSAFRTFRDNHLNTSAGTPFIAEQFVSFHRELATVAVRSQSGEIFFYPLVEAKQKDARCLWVKGPVKASAPATRKYGELCKRFIRLLETENYVGALGIELFETPDGLWVNELAPRVHNTAHYTQNAFTISQFAAHMLAVSGGALRTPRALAKGFAMWNLLGTRTAAIEGFSPPTSDGDVYFHWYGKHEGRPGRKLGHVNAVAKTPDAALALAKQFAAQSKRELAL